MVINNIKKIGSGKYQINLDNNEKIITYDEVILNNNLLYKKELAKEEIEKINRLNNYYDLYNKTLKYISKKLRSEKEVYIFLEKLDSEKNNINSIIDKLINNGLIDDNKFLKSYIYDRFYLSSDGPLKIKKDLLKHDIDDVLIDKELTSISDDEILSKLSKIILKKKKVIKKSSKAAKEKIYHDLYNLGYSKELIDLSYVDDYDDHLQIEKDFDKLYRNLTKKDVIDDSIYKKIRMKLLLKGYSLDEIEVIINKKKILN